MCAGRGSAAARLIPARCACMASVSAKGTTRPPPCRSLDGSRRRARPRTPPVRESGRAPTSCAGPSPPAAGSPRRARLRVIGVFWPRRAVARLRGPIGATVALTPATRVRARSLPGARRGSPPAGRAPFSNAARAFGSRPWWRGRADSLRKLMARGSRPSVRRLTETPNSSRTPCTGSTSRQRTTPSGYGFGPASTARAGAARRAGVGSGVFPGALRSISPSGPSASTRTTRSAGRVSTGHAAPPPHRTIRSPTPPILAASLRAPPSWIAASATSRRVWRASRLAFADALRSSAAKSVRKAVAAQMEILPRRAPWNQLTPVPGPPREPGSARAGISGPWQVHPGPTPDRAILADRPDIPVATGGQGERTHVVFGVGEAWRRLAKVARIRPRGAHEVGIEAVTDDPAGHAADASRAPPPPVTGRLPRPRTAPVVADLMARRIPGDALRAVRARTPVPGAGACHVETAGGDAPTRPASRERARPAPGWPAMRRRCSIPGAR